MKQGYVHFYYGDGKGKTTAAAGMTLRCAGHGLRVLFSQFLKSGYSGEITALKHVAESVDTRRFHSQKRAVWEMTVDERCRLAEESREGLKTVAAAVERNNYSLVVLDELLNAVKGDLLEADEICRFLENRNPAVEYVLTGRILPDAVRPYGDYITQMVKIRHPYDEGVTARLGVER